MAAKLSVACSRLRLTPEHCVQDATVHFYALGPSAPMCRWCKRCATCGGCITRDDDDGRPRWRPAAELPPVGERLQSPYDPEMHYSTKRQMEWSGYKVHVTEACDEDAAHLVTHVKACPAMEQDMTSTAQTSGFATAEIHERLAVKELLPAERLVDSAFSRTDCGACADRALCTPSKDARRSIYFHQRPEYEALNAARAWMDDPAWRRRYRVRAGIESTLSQGVRAFGMRRSRYVGLAKTGLQQVCTAAAMNVSRTVNWLDGRPWAKTPVMRFAALAQAA